MKAIVLFHPRKKSLFSMSEIPLDGFVLFKQEYKDEPVKVTIYLKGLPEGPHGFHIHEKSMTEINKCNDVRDCCKQLGGHFNTEPLWGLNNLQGVKHGQHTGDLCFNIFSDNGLAEHHFVDPKISLYPQEKNNIIDRTLVIHAERDDMGMAHYEDEDKNIESLITGNAGPRIACGQIKLLKNENL